MADKSEDAWFYSQGGQQHGPVPFEELKAKVKELDPTNDLAWKEGMANWTPVGQMGETFGDAAKPSPEPKPESKPQPAPEPKPQPKSKPAPEPKPEPARKQALQAAPAEEASKKKKKKKIKIEGNWEGANRLHYFLGLFVFPIVFLVILMVAAPFLGGLAGIAILLGILLITIVAIVITLKRFTNLVMSRWWLLGLMVPFLNLWLYYRLFACPPGYGEHKTLGGAGIALALLYWLSLIGSVAAGPILAVIAMTTALDNPEFMEQINNDPEAREQLHNMLIELRKAIE